MEDEPAAEGSAISLTAVFDPSGLLGHARWYALWPIYTLIFGGMLRRIAARAVLPRTDTRSTRTRHTFSRSVVRMDEARRVIERLERIEWLDRATADPEMLLTELRGLLGDAEAWSRREGDDAADDAVVKLREVLAVDAVPA